MAQFPAATSSALAQKSPSERRAAATHGDRTQGPTLLRPPTALPCLAAGLRKEQSRPLLSSQGRGVQALFTRTIDPCSVLDLPTLKDGAAPALGKAFPFTVQEGGDELTLYDPSLHNAT